MQADRQTCTQTNTTHACIYTYICTYRPTDRQTDRQRETDRQAGRQADRHAHKQIQHMHTCIHKYVHTCMHAYIHTYIHTYIHVYRDAHMHVHTCVCIRMCVCFCSLVLISGVSVVTSLRVELGFRRRSPYVFVHVCSAHFNENCPASLEVTRYCTDFNSYQYYGHMFPSNTAIVSHTSNVPHHDIGNQTGLHVN